MNFGKRGWFATYLAYRQAHPFERRLPSSGVRMVEDPTVHNESDEAIYYFLQPTGLLYGAPLDQPFPEQDYPGSEYHGTAERAHLIFLEALFASLVADREFLLEGLVDEADRLAPAVDMAMEYFVNYPATDARPGGALPDVRAWLYHFGRERLRFEREISHRIRAAGDGTILPQFFSANSFQFLELYHCLLWQRQRLIDPEFDLGTLHDLYAQQATQREALLRLTIAVAHADGVVSEPERVLIERLLSSARLPAATETALRRAMVEGLRVEDVELPPMPWIIRRYVLELVLLTVMLDREVTPAEQETVAYMVERLGLWGEERHQSQTALEMFLLDKGDRLHFLKRRPERGQLREHLREKATLALRRNMHRIVNEVRETQELYALLNKATHTALTPEEWKKVNAQLLDVMKTIPAVAIWALPGGGFVLPILIKLLPFNILPSSFKD